MSAPPPRGCSTSAPAFISSPPSSPSAARSEVKVASAASDSRNRMERRTALRRDGGAEALKFLASVRVKTGMRIFFLPGRRYSEVHDEPCTFVDELNELYGSGPGQGRAEGRMNIVDSTGLEPSPLGAGDPAQPRSLSLIFGREPPRLADRGWALRSPADLG